MSSTKRKNKVSRLPRGSRGLSSASNPDVYHDLDVPLITMKNTSNVTVEASNASWFWRQHQPILQRLHSTGYAVVALSHTVYGKMDLQRDSASNRFPSPPLTFPPPPWTNEKTDHPSKNVPRLRIVKRLNVVLEQVSDLTYYYLPLSTSSDTTTTAASYSTTTCQKNPYHDFLREYDIIAMSPRNDAVFSAICSTAHLLWVHVLTLDYTAGRGGVQLPFTFKSLSSSNLSLASSQGLFFEIPYSPAIIDGAKRKAFIQTAKQLQLALLPITKNKHSSIPLIFSSGNRRRTTQETNEDIGPMALRQPGDLQNFCQVVLDFQGMSAKKLFQDNPQRIIERGKEWNIRKFSPHLHHKMENPYKSHVTFQVSVIKEDNNSKDNDMDMKIKIDKEEEIEETAKKRLKKSDTVKIEKKRDTVNDDEDDELNDGFLQFS